MNMMEAMFIEAESRAAQAEAKCEQTEVECDAKLEALRKECDVRCAEMQSNCDKMQSDLYEAQIKNAKLSTRLEVMDSMRSKYDSRIDSLIALMQQEEATETESPPQWEFGVNRDELGRMTGLVAKPVI